MMACSHGEYDGSIGSSDSSELPEGHTVAIKSSSTINTKVAIDPSDMQTVVWSNDDQIAIWAIADGVEAFTFAASTFSMFYYTSDYSTAVFTANIDEMEQGSYTYYATYPTPKSVTNSSTVTFSIPSAQSGYYDGDADIMLAKGVSGDALSDNANYNCELDFIHLTHAIRIEIPEEKDLLGNTTSLQITFPQNVVGDISFDVTDPDAVVSLSSASSVIYVDYEAVIAQSGYIWIFINPTTINGDIEFIGYSDDGTPSAPITTTLSNREMAAGKITPITLTIPEPNTKAFVLRITDNNIGEDMESVTLTAPSGAYFYGGYSEITVDASEDGTFLFRYIVDTYEAAFMAGEISVTFESENTSVPSDALKITSAHSSDVNYVDYSMPYLFEEDFSTISGSSQNKNLYESTISNLSYWTGYLYQYYAGARIALTPYSFTSLKYYDSHVILDLDGKTYLKAGCTVSLYITYQADWNDNKCDGMSLIVSGGTGSSTISLSNTSASYTSSLTDREVTLSGCSSTSEITWESVGDVDGAFGYDYIYLDNIKIQISK